MARVTGARGVDVAVKTGEEGSVTIGERLLRELLDHKSALAASDDDLVFPTRRGTHGNASNFRTRVFQPVLANTNAKLAEAGRRLVPASLTPHGLRHTYCSLLVSQGADVATVAAQMRHADLTTTLRYYTHAQQHLRKAAADTFDAVVWGISDSIPGRKQVASFTSDSADTGGERPGFGSARGFQGTRPAGFEPATSASGGQRSIH
jgi:integrase